MQNYQELALRTESPITPELIERLTGNARAVHAFFGLLTETGELADGFKRAIFYGKPLDTTNIKEEVGDAFWYLAILCDTLGVNFIDCMSANIKKLSTRYPDKYTHEAALNRDLPAERKVLEGNLPKDSPTLGELLNGPVEEAAPKSGSVVFHLEDLGETVWKAEGGDQKAISLLKSSYEQAQRRFGLTRPYNSFLLQTDIYRAILTAFKTDDEKNGKIWPVPLINGFDVARELASWMDGQTRERALKHIAVREQQYKDQTTATMQKRWEAMMAAASYDSVAWCKKIFEDMGIPIPNIEEDKKSC